MYQARDVAYDGCVPMKAALMSARMDRKHGEDSLFVDRDNYIVIVAIKESCLCGPPPDSFIVDPLTSRDILCKSLVEE